MCKLTYSKETTKIILLKKQSKNLSKVTKRILEISIKENEEVKMKYIHANSQKLCLR